MIILTKVVWLMLGEINMIDFKKEYLQGKTIKTDPLELYKTLDRKV